MGWNLCLRNSHVFLIHSTPTSPASSLDWIIVHQVNHWRRGIAEVWRFSADKALHEQSVRFMIMIIITCIIAILFGLENTGFKHRLEDVPYHAPHHYHIFLQLLPNNLTWSPCNNHHLLLHYCHYRDHPSSFRKSDLHPPLPPPLSFVFSQLVPTTFKRQWRGIEENKSH